MDPDLMIERNTEDVEMRQSFSVTQALPFPGKLGLREEMAAAEAHRLRAEYEAFAREIAREVSDAYLELAFVYSAIEINERLLDLVRSVESSADARYRAGIAPQQDVIRAQIQLTRLRHRSIVLERERKLAEERLNELFGRPARTSLPRPEDPAAGELPSDLDALREQAFQSRPEIAAAEADLRGSLARADLAELEYLPDFTLGATFDDRAMADDSWTATAGLNLPIYTGKRAAAVREASAMIEQAKAMIARSRTAVDRDVTTAWEDAARAQAEMTLFQDTLLPQVKQGLESAQAGYQNGQVDFTTLVEALMTQQDVDLDFQMARKDYRQALERLLWATGTRDLSR